MKLFCLCMAMLGGALTGCIEEPSYSYHYPLTSPGGQFSTLPPTVQNSVRAQAGMAEIYDIHKNEGPNGTIYQFRFKNAEIFPTLYVAPDGSVLGPDMNVAVGATADSIAASIGTGVGTLRLTELPPRVVQTIRRTAPTGEAEFIIRTSDGAETFYEITFKDAANHPRLLIKDNGTLVE